ncbi:inositol monophosphatase [Rhodobacteraceae bacterium CCMM004]|nr:inositol monophosphatase [Rhodobacteraceae bacterium CCMM004]
MERRAGLRTGPCGAGFGLWVLDRPRGDGDPDRRGGVRPGLAAPGRVPPVISPRDGCAQDDLDTLADLVRAAGARARADFERQEARAVETKSPGDFVSDADRAVERILRDGLTGAFPGIAVVGEEYGGPDADLYWSVDPIDGTSNFLSGLPTWAVSVGLVRGGVPVMGVVHAPALGLLVQGGEGCGVRVAGAAAGSAPARPPCFAVGRNSGWPKADRHAAEDRHEARGHTVVSLGSCALSLAYVAAGRLGGYEERFLSGMWDCAAGAALCRAAGATVEIARNRDGTVDIRAVRR